MTVIADLNPEAPLVAPSRLTVEHRIDFRRQAISQLESVAARELPTLEIDMRATIDIDASGLGILVLLQKRAREVNVGVRLSSASKFVRVSLEGARLEHLFEFID